MSVLETVTVWLLGAMMAAALLFALFDWHTMLDVAGLFACAASVAFSAAFITGGDR